MLVATRVDPTRVGGGQLSLPGVSWYKPTHDVMGPVGEYRMGPGGIANDKPVLAFGDCTCQMAILLSLSVVVGLCHGEDSTKLVLKFVDGLRGDHAIEASQFVPKLDEHIVCFV